MSREHQYRRLRDALEDTGKALGLNHFWRRVETDEEIYQKLQRLKHEIDVYERSIVYPVAVRVTVTQC